MLCFVINSSPTDQQLSFTINGQCRSKHTMNQNWCVLLQLITICFKPLLNLVYMYTRTYIYIYTLYIHILVIIYIYIYVLEIRFCCGVSSFHWSIFGGAPWPSQRCILLAQDQPSLGGTAHQNMGSDFFLSLSIFLCISLSFYWFLLISIKYWLSMIN